MKTALITGSLGQDGTYLTEYLLDCGYRVFCGIRSLPTMSQTIEKSSWALSVLNTGKVDFIYLDVRDEMSIRVAIKKAWPDEIYNLAGQVYVPISWESPAETFDVNTGGLSRILKVAFEVKKDTRVYQASSSEMYGNHPGTCTDKTPMNPTSPYGVSKYASHRLVGLYRDKGLHVSAGILFNHESPRRGHEMVTRKIAKKVAEWAMGSDEILQMGNMDSRRDWGFAGEYVKAMHKILQQPSPDDYVVGTAESHSVSDFLFEAARVMNIELSFVQDHLETDSRFVRTQEIFDMRADNSKIKDSFGWEPVIKFKQLVKLMVEAEYEKLSKGKEQKTWVKTY